MTYINALFAPMSRTGHVICVQAVEQRKTRKISDGWPPLVVEKGLGD